jgi:hypothetical protein
MEYTFSQFRYVHSCGLEIKMVVMSLCLSTAPQIPILKLAVGRREWSLHASAALLTEKKLSVPI